MDELVTIATFDVAGKAETIKLLLEQEGFEVFIADDNLATANWFLSGAVGGVKLQVRESDAPRAASFVEETRKHMSQEKNNKPDVSFACEDCGGALTFPGKRRGGVETCKHCGSFVDVPD